MPDDGPSTTLKGSVSSPKTGKSGKKAAGAKNKSAFVRRYPNLSPKEVAAKGKEQGVKLTAGYVSTIRSKDKAKNGGAKRRGGKGRPSGGEAEFRRALQGVTLDRAREIIEEVARAYKG